MRLATRGRTQRAVEREQSFALDCECGQQHTGQRRRRPHTIVCNTCGAALFVLPANPYPVPPEPQRKPRKGPPRRKDTAPGESLSDSMAELPAATADRVGSFVRRATAATTGSLRRSVRSAGRHIAAATRATQEFLSNPVTLVILGLLLVMGVSSAWMVRRSLRESAMATYRSRSEAGFRAFAEGDLSTAADDLMAAARAAERLGWPDDEADPSERHEVARVRVAARELHALTHLLIDPLPDLLRKLADDPFPEGRWSPEAARRYDDGWIVWEGPLTPGQIDVPTDIDGRTLRLDLSNLAFLAELPPDDDARVPEAIFAGQLASITREPGRYTIRLQPETAFLWQSMQTYEELGIPFDFTHSRAIVQQRLKRQAAVNGLPIEVFPGEDADNGPGEDLGDESPEEPAAASAAARAANEAAAAPEVR